MGVAITEHKWKLNKLINEWDKILGVIVFFCILNLTSIQKKILSKASMHNSIQISKVKKLYSWFINVTYWLYIDYIYIYMYYMLKKDYDLFKHHLIQKVSFVGFASLWRLLSALFITLNMSSKILVKEFSLWANYISSYCYSWTFKHFQHSSEAWHTEWKLKFHMWIWLQILNCYCLGSLFYLGPPTLYIPHTEANDAFGEMCALFLSQPDGKEELSQVWARRICWLKRGLLRTKTVGMDKSYDPRPVEA